MQIEHINSAYKFLPKVKLLGKKNAATLGFMPEGGFDDHANKNCIIIAHKDEELCGYLMYRVVNRHSRISVAHLCVDSKYRGQGLTKLLLNSLRTKYEDRYNGISLSCREDYKEASGVWKKYGFIYKDRVRSRSIDEHYLNKWWYDFGKPNLFSTAYESSSKIKALFDANIIMKLRDGDNCCSPSEDPRMLLYDWLIDETIFYYAPEMYNEIDRDTDHARAKKTRNFLENFQEAHCNIESIKNIEKELKNIFSGKTENDISDRRQLATSIVSGIPYFITFDKGILSKKDEVEDVYNIQIHTPHEFVLKIDQLLHKDEYSPTFLKGVTTHKVGKITDADLNKCIKLFTDKEETTSIFMNKLLDAISRKDIVEVIKDEHNEPLAIYASSIKDLHLHIHFLRVKQCNISKTIYMQVLSDFTYKAIHASLNSLVYYDECISDEFKEILHRIGYANTNRSWIKYIYDDIIDSASITDYLRKKGFGFSPKTTNELLSAEFHLFPLKIWDLDIPCYIIPIVPYWASQLFDFKMASTDLFGADPNRLWNIENVYYRKTKPITEIAPARILWYASDDKDIVRSKAIVATSYLDEVLTGKPKDLFRDNKHYGIYEWHNIYQLCENNIEKDIRLLRFSRTEVFDHPVSWDITKKILKTEGSIQSPRKVDKKVFEEIYRLGSGKSK